MAHYQVFLETSQEALEEGGYIARVPELIGCVARGKTKEEAIAKTRDALDAYRVLMRQRGIAVADEPIELDVTETDATTFPPDYVPLRDDELEGLWERAAFSRQTLLDMLNALPADALAWKPAADAWAIRNTLAHIAQADLWYASRLEEGGLRELLWRLAATRSLLLQHLQNLPADARGRVTKHNGEEWTPRKVARRMLEHEREHLEQIREILEKYAGKQVHK